MNRDAVQVSEKKVYTPPQITVVLLRPEEAVLGFCKSPSVTGPNGSACVIVPGTSCFSAGS